MLAQRFGARGMGSAQAPDQVWRLQSESLQIDFLLAPLVL